MYCNRIYHNLMGYIIITILPGLLMPPLLKEALRNGYCGTSPSSAPVSLALGHFKGLLGWCPSELNRCLLVEISPITINNYGFLFW